MAFFKWNQLYCRTINYMPLSFEEADRLAQEIESFLVRCGGVYKNGISGLSQSSILVSIAVGQYLYEKDKYFICWWKIKPEDIELLKKKIMPVDVCNGTSVYIAEYGTTEKGRMFDMVKKLRGMFKDCKGVYWHRKNNKFKEFSKQKGG